MSLKRVSLKFVATCFATFMCIALAAPAVQAQEIADNYLNPPATDAEGHANPFVDSEEAALFDEAITLEEETSDTLISPMKTKVGVNPYGCHGRTHLVHKSGGMSSVHSGIIECKRPISTMVNGAEIMKKGWLGMWHRSAFSSKTVRNKSQVDTHAKAVCGNTSMQTYRGNGYHRITHGGKNYIARTSSVKESRFACDS